MFDWRPAGLHCTLSLPHDTKMKAVEWTTSNSKHSGTRRPFQFGLSKNSGNVLLVEDESLVAMMVEEVLSELGLRVIGPYGTIGEALRAASEIAIDAAVLDINLGGQSILSGCRPLT